MIKLKSDDKTSTENFCLLCLMIKFLWRLINYGVISSVQLTRKREERSGW